MTTNIQTTQTQREKARVIAVIKSLRDKHVAKYGTEDRYLVRIGHRVGVSGQVVSNWSRGHCLPRNRALIDALGELDKRKDPFDFSYLSYYEKPQPGNNPPGKV